MSDDKEAGAGPARSGMPASTPRSANVPSSPARSGKEPPRRRRSDAAKGEFVVVTDLLLTFATLVGLALVVFVNVAEREFNAPGALAESKVVLIPKGSGTRDVAAILDREGVIGARDGILPDDQLFALGTIYSGARDKLKAGEYEIPAGASMKTVLDIIVAGRSIEHTITIPEGLTSEQIVARLKAEALLEGEVTRVPREGTLLPETYRFMRGDSRDELIARMLEAHKKVLADIWAKRSPDIPVSSPEELVTLASIVEKETGKASERPLVAGVFANRLKKKMRLQSDPTIIYGLVGGKGSLGRPILRSEITKATPYNTYVIPGLPPGPIANPGRAAIEATANPEETTAIYFVADGTGGHTFASTLDEHNRNVAKLREIEAAAAAAAAAAASPAAAAPAAGEGTAAPTTGAPTTGTAATAAGAAEASGATRSAGAGSDDPAAAATDPAAATTGAAGAAGEESEGEAPGAEIGPAGAPLPRAAP